MNVEGGGGSFSENEATGRTTFSSSSYSPSPLEPRNKELLPRVSAAEEITAIEKEHMFDKVVTPSDVGKLNRLVIPKQHAEKYFPLDSSTNEKGLLLNFEDRTGKPWRFRYSYWNSSQSYVMTKGWSRFVKEKKLDAGDVVSFQRGLGESGKDRLYIDWRRRPDPPNPNHHHLHHYHHHTMNYSHYGYGVPPTPNHYLFRQRSVPWSPLLMRPPGSSSSLAAPEHHYNMNVHPYRNSNAYVSGGGGYGYGNVINVNPVYYVRSGGGGGGGVFPLHEQEGIASSLHHQVGPGLQMGLVNVIEPSMVLESVPVVHGKVAVATGKRLRQFGVNMDCAEVSDDQSEECVEILSSSTTATSAATSTALSQLEPQLQLRLYDTAPPTTDIFNRGNKTSSPSTSMSLDFDLSEQ